MNDGLRPVQNPGPEKTAKECAFAILGRADRTEQQLRQKLKEKQYPPSEIEETVTLLKEYHYLDDADYAERYVRSYSASRSALRMKNTLLQRGVARELIDRALEEEPVDEESQIRRFLLKKGVAPGTAPGPDTARRLTAALARRGYPFDAIRRVMEDLEAQGDNI